METILTGLLVPMLGIVLGSAMVFLTGRQMSDLLQKSLLGFAAGVMVSASFWSLLLPAVEMNEGRWAVLPAAIGFLAGIGFLLFIDIVTPHIHFGTTQPEGPRTGLSRTTMLMLAITIHHLPEGMAIGVVLAGAIQNGAGISTASALVVALGIAIQNVPEGAVVSIPMRASGKSRTRSFLMGCLSGIAQPLGAVMVLLLAALFVPVLPYLLAFAAGAMLYVVVEEIIPEASSGQHTNHSTILFAAGFVIMMMLDIVLD
ncbi:MAG: ZIP family metal transporter [Bacteroidaceae bacterium]|nr:ZIP family metal transporter [Bacteroidaceae bacterium]